MGFAFDEDYRPRLLALPSAVQRGGGAMEGRVGRQRGGKLEFREHRPYVAGDDPRAIDWDAWLRLGQLLAKEHDRDEAPEVLVILDRSASMGPEASGKDRIAREIAGGLLHLGMGARCTSTLAILAEGGPVTLGRYRSQLRLDALLSLLERLSTTEGPTHLGRLGHLPPPGPAGRIAFLISDFLADPLPAEGIVALSRGSGTGALVHVVTEEERRPQLAKDGFLEDPETAARLAYSDGPRLEQAYLEELAAHEKTVRGLALQHGMFAVAASDATPFEAIVSRALGLGALT